MLTDEACECFFTEFEHTVFVVDDDSFVYFLHLGDALQLSFQSIAFDQQSRNSQFSLLNVLEGHLLQPILEVAGLHVDEKALYFFLALLVLEMRGGDLLQLLLDD